MSLEDQAILDFGTSVGVNDEIRRTVVSQTEDLQQSIQKIKDAYALESKIHDQLTKDQTHARRETKDLRRGSSEVHERLAIMHQKIFREMFPDSLKLELSISGTGDSAESKENGEEMLGEDGGDVAMEGSDENAPPPTDEAAGRKINPHSIVGIIQSQGVLSHKYWKFSSYVDEAEQETKAFQSRRQDAADKTQRAVQEVTKLQSELSKIQKTTASFSHNRQEEDERRCSLEIKLSDLKVAFEKASQAAEEKKQTLNSKVSTFAQLKEKLEAELAALSDSERRYSAALDAKTADAQAMVKQQEELESEYAQYCAWKVAYEAQQTRRETERKERQSLFSLHKEMEAQWSTRKARLEILQKDLAKSDKKIEERAQEIPKAEMRIQNICDEIAKKNKEAEELDALLAKADTEAADSSIDAVAEEENRLKRLEAELQAALQEEEGFKTALDKEGRLLSKTKQAHEEQCSDLESKKADLEENLAEKKTVLGRDEERVKKSMQLKRRYEVLKYGAEVLKLTKKKEKKYLEEPKSNRDETAFE